MTELRKVLYRCKRCGEIITQLFPPNTQIDAEVDKLLSNKDSKISQYIFHLCKRGNIGIAELIGWN